MGKDFPLITNLIQMAESQPLSFHTPGHKSGTIVPPKLKQLFGESLWQYDLTEVADLDNLHQPTGVILESQQKAAQLSGSKESHFLVNGTTVGIQASIMSNCRNQPVFVPRNVHKSVYHSLILANARPIYLPIVVDEELGIPLGVDPNILSRYIEQYPDCKHLIMVYPTYHGITYKTKECIDIAKDCSLIVIVDEAHGSHLMFSELTPPSAVQLGADLVIQSWHKTLPVLTQASVLQVGKNYQGNSILPYLQLLQTTSPSYLLLSSLESAVELMAQDGRQLIEDSIEVIAELHEQINQLTTLYYLHHKGYGLDPFKLYLVSSKLSGAEIAERLEQEQIFSEMNDMNGCLLILPIYLPQDIMMRLVRALQIIDQTSLTQPDRPFVKSFYLSTPPPCKRNLAESFYHEKESIDLSAACGRVSGDFIMRYPPGIPIVVPGEEITKEVISLLKKEQAQTVTVLTDTTT